MFHLKSPKPGSIVGLISRFREKLQDHLSTSPIIVSGRSDQQGLPDDFTGLPGDILRKDRSTQCASVEAF